jgi:hypothetical protein
MKLPALLHGTETEVRKHCQAVEKSIARGASLAEALSGAEEIDTTDRPGLIVMQYARRPLAGQHFFTFLLPDQIAEGILRDRIDRKRERDLFEELLMPPWGVVGLLSMTVGDRWTAQHVEWIRDLVAAVQKHWDALVAEGPRYTKGDAEGKQAAYAGACRRSRSDGGSASARRRSTHGESRVALTTCRSHLGANRCSSSVNPYAPNPWFRRGGRLNESIASRQVKTVRSSPLIWLPRRGSAWPVG